MSEEYEKAKDAFFEKLGLPAGFDSYLLKRIDEKNQKKGEEIRQRLAIAESAKGAAAHLAGALKKAQEGYDTAQEGGHAAKAYFAEWIAQIEALLESACFSYVMEDVYAVWEAGGRRKWGHFWKEKLRNDIALCEAEDIVFWRYEKVDIRPKRTLYHQAGLLYYLGVMREIFIFPDETFPSHIQKEDGNLDRFKSRLTEARKYLLVQRNEEGYPLPPDIDLDEIRERGRKEVEKIR